MNENRKNATMEQTEEQGKKRISLKNKLSPSILAANFKNLEQDILQTVNAGADMLHIDVMDGNFVPSISFGMPMIASIRSASDVFFDVHLMVTDPGRYIEDFKRCGADGITVHAEACTHLDRVIKEIKEAGLKAAVALNPATPLCLLDYVLEQIDMILIMTVNPGFGGQHYIAEATGKIKSLRERLHKQGLATDIQVDGGITRDNVQTVLEAGANVIVAGTSIFKGNIEDNTRTFKALLQRNKT